MLEEITKGNKDNIEVQVKETILSIKMRTIDKLKMIAGRKIVYKANTYYKKNNLRIELKI